MANQLTIRLDDELGRLIREVAEREGISLNRAAVRMLRKGAGLERTPGPDAIGASLDWFFGTGMTEDEARALDQAVRELDVIESSRWS